MLILVNGVLFLRENYVLTFDDMHMLLECFAMSEFQNSQRKFAWSISALADQVYPSGSAIMVQLDGFALTQS